MKQNGERNNKMTIKIIGVICLLFIFAFLLPKKTFGNSQTNYVPQFYGTTNITIKVGDNLDLNHSFYRIFAKDFEDGSLTKDIKVTKNTVNTAQEGNYEIAYEVTDSDKNTVNITVPVNVISKGERKIQRTFYTLPDVSHMNQAGFFRGNNHDKQDLGIYLPADTSVTVKQINDSGQDLQVQFLNDDSLKESMGVYAYKGASKDSEEVNFMNENTVIVNDTNQIISRDANTKLENVVSVIYRNSDGEEYFWDKYNGKSFASVPFVKTLYNTSVAPIVEITLNDDIKPLDYYTYGDDMEKFKNQWRNSGNEFAVLEGSRVTFLVPSIDLDDLGISKKTDDSTYYINDTFESIDDLLIYYDELIEEYDEWIGLSYNPSKESDQNIKTKFFIKSNIHGIGGAAYNYASYIYQTSNSLDGFLHNIQDGWGPLHEIGHGYQGNFKWLTLDIREVSNNFLAYYYQKENLQGSFFPKDINVIDKGIMENVRKTAESYLLTAEAGGTNSAITITDENGDEMNLSIHYTRLYAYINLLNKIGAKNAIAKTYSDFRTNIQIIDSVPVADVFSIGFSNASGYNVIPYFKEWKLDFDKDTENEIYSKDYPIVYFLRDLVKNDTQAEAIRKDLNLEGTYSLVSNEDISKYKLAGNVSINLTAEEFNNLKNYDILLKSGEDIVKQISVTSKNFMISNVPIGAYEIETTRANKTIVPRYITVQQDNTSNVAVVTENAELTGITVKTPPSKTEYIEGQSFDSKGMVVTATYANGSTAPVSNYTVIDGENLKVGKDCVTISYTENGVTKKNNAENNSKARRNNFNHNK